MSGREGRVREGAAIEGQPRLRDGARRFLGRRRVVVARLAAWSVAEAAQTFLLGFALARAIDDGFLADRVAVGLGWLAAAALAVAVGSYGTGRVYRSVADLVEPLRDELLRRVVTRALREADDSAVSRAAHQVEIARDTFGGLVMVSRGFVFTAAGALVGLCSLAPVLLLVVLPPLVLGLALFAVTLRPMARSQETYLAADEAIARGVGVAVGGLRDVTAGGAEERVAREVGERFDAEWRASRTLARWGVCRDVALGVGGRLPVVLLLVTAPWLLGNGVTPGALVGALAYLTQSMLPALQALMHGLGTSGTRLGVVLRRLTGAGGGVGSAADAAVSATDAPGPADTEAAGAGTAPELTVPAGPALPGPADASGRTGSTGAPGRPALPAVPELPALPAGTPAAPATSAASASAPGMAGRGSGARHAKRPRHALPPKRLTLPGGIAVPGRAPGGRYAQDSGAYAGDDADNAPAEAPLPAWATPPAGSGLALEARGVSFAYGEHATPVVQALELTLPIGGHLAVVGPSGIGKSTLAALLAGVLVPDRGEIRLGGNGAGSRRVLVPQQAYVFSGTLRENMLYLCPRPEEVPDTALRASAVAVGAADLVRQLGGFGARVTPGTLSAGERQLIALARAHLAPAPLAILDEAGCHLDATAEARAERAFAARPGGSLIVVAHRISSALRADRILVMDGTYALCGRHRDLLRRSALYRDLVGEWADAGAEPALAP
ncbi:ATP-binding cassette domain-containing protein [Streptomyces ochraceiscleroticus]|uniref:ATP-binding cassette domain-containing protein n=1 Tax=Streptomyces ochraceiscleroticus TaxID=47761 RepID=A0ABW1MGG7_9ACTN|nr:ABC transporter ATP-binding protein [Streptomyces ochraceiscleroticus]